MTKQLYLYQAFDSSNSDKTPFEEERVKGAHQHRGLVIAESEPARAHHPVHRFEPALQAPVVERGHRAQRIDVDVASTTPTSTASRSER